MKKDYLSKGEKEFCEWLESIEFIDSIQGGGETMGGDAYTELLQFQGQLDGKIRNLMDREQQISSELAQLEVKLMDADSILDGTSDDFEEEIETLETEVTKIRRQISALQNPSLNGKYGELVKKFYAESVDTITGKHRKEFDAKVKELEKIKKQFLSKVKELGEIKRQSDSVTSRTMNLMLTIPGKKLGVPTLADGIISRPNRHAGAIFIDPITIYKLYKGVV